MSTTPTPPTGTLTINFVNSDHVPTLEESHSIEQQIESIAKFSRAKTDRFTVFWIKYTEKLFRVTTENGVHKRDRYSKTTIAEGFRGFSIFSEI